MTIIMRIELPFPVPLKEGEGSENLWMEAI
jgi:hypothetical protein